MIPNPEDLGPIRTLYLLSPEPKGRRTKIHLLWMKDNLPGGFPYNGGRTVNPLY
jgi:hypothetical protein